MDKAEIVFYKYAETKGLEKTAFIQFLRPAVTLGKIMHKAYKTKGLRAAISTGAKYRDPAASIAKGVKNVGAMRHGAARSWGVRELGNIAYNLETLGKGVGRSQGVAKSFAQAGKNLLELGKSQIRAAKYKRVSPWMVQNGKLRGGGLLVKSKFFDRKVVGTAGKDLLVKKRKAMLPFSLAFTAPGFAAQDVLSQKGNVGQKALAGAKSYAAWGISPTIGMASLLAGK